MTDSCVICGAPVEWITLANPEKGEIRVDPDPTPKGSYMRLVSGPQRGEWIRVGGPLVEKCIAEGVDLHRPHEETCRER